jgi:hypothetical protein
VALMMLDGIAVRKQGAAVLPGATGVSCRASQRLDMSFTIRKFIDDSREIVETAMRRPSSGGVL